MSLNKISWFSHNFLDKFGVLSEMEGQKIEGEVQNIVQSGRYKDKGVAVFTSGGDAQGIALCLLFLQ